MTIHHRLHGEPALSRKYQPGGFRIDAEALCVVYRAMRDN